MRSVRSESRTAFAVFVALALLHTWPLGTSFWRLSLNHHADAQLNAWIVRWVAHAVASHPAHLFDTNIFALERGTLAYSEPLIVPALSVAPVAWAGASPALLFNVLAIGGLVLTAWSAWRLCRDWTGSHGAALVAGALVAFNVHTLTRLAHLAAAHLWGLPLALLLADRLIERRSWRAIAALGAVVAATAATSLYSLALVLVILAVVVAVGARAWRGALAIAGATAGGLLVALPILLPYARLAASGATRPVEMVSQFSATLAGYVTSTSRAHAWWNGAILNDVNVWFAGAAAIALAALGFARSLAGDSTTRRRAVTLIVLGAAGLLLSLGPATPIYRWLYDVAAPLRGFRAAARFGMLFLLALAIAAAYGVAWVERRWRHATRAAIVILAVVTVEAWQGPVRTVATERVPAVYRLLRDDPAPVVLVEVPFFPAEAIFENGEYVYNSTAHWRPLMNGYSGYTPASYRRRAASFWFFPENWAVDAIKREGATHVMVHLERFGRDAEAVRDAIARRPDLELLAVDPRGHQLYRIR